MKGNETIQHDLGKLYMMGQTNSLEKSLVAGNGTRKVNRKIVVQDEGCLPSKLYEYRCKLLAHL